MRKTFVLLIIFLCFHNVYSQTDFREAYIITNEGDTISGFAVYREGANNYKLCNFKESENQESVVYSPAQLKAYRFVDDKFFESREITIKNGNSERVFAEILVKGKITLFKFYSRYFVSKDTSTYELKNEQQEVVINGNTLLKNTNKHIGILTYLLSECVGLRDKISNIRINEKELTKLIEKYNNCTGEPTMTFKAKKPWFKVSTGVEVGFTASFIKFSSNGVSTVYDYLTSDFDQDHPLSAGANIKINSPRLNEKIAFYAGINYMQTKYISFNTQFKALYINRNDVSIEIEQLKIPIGLRYTLSGGNISPYFNLGVSNTIHLSSSTLWIKEKETELNKVVETSEGHALNIIPYQFGYWGGVGINKKIISKLTAHLELKYELTNGVSKKSEDFTSKITNIQLLIGISF